MKEKTSRADLINTLFHVKKDESQIFGIFDFLIVTFSLKAHFGSC